MQKLKKIMHVDDDSDIRVITKMSLEVVGGFQLEQCASGREAIERAPVFIPDVILLDVMMPEMDGEETFDALKRIDGVANVPVIFMTAKAQEDVRSSLRAKGAIEVITKPFDPMTLPQEIESIWQAYSKTVGDRV